MKLPLDGIKVLDLSRLVPGPLCSQFLADLGAEVIKIEDHMGGDYCRWFPPTIKEQCCYFYTLNRNKKSIRLNLRDERGKEIFKGLAKNADVIIEAFRPNVMSKLGLGYEDIKAIKPDIVYCSITGYGQTSPNKDLPGHDVNYLSITGILSTIGTKEGQPVIPTTPFSDVAGSYSAAVSILGALMGKERNGNGQYIDISIADCAAPFQVISMPKYIVDGINPKMSNETLSGYFACYDLYLTKDNRYLACGNGEEKFWEEFCKAIGCDDAFVKDIYADEQRQEEMRSEVANIMKSKNHDEWLEIFENYDVCVTLVKNYEEALDDPHIKSRQLWYQVDHPVEGKITQMSFPAKFSDYNVGMRSMPPDLGEHTAEVVKALGYSESDIDALIKEKII